MENDQVTAKTEVYGLDQQRQQLEQFMYQEAQRAGSPASMDLYKAVSQELNNMSDRGIEIMLRHKH
ncbi:hypothetical protein [Bacillus tuaregi]|uniref:hypothetical protein n=1 Tax=Bacillus tuaregi TaxID=1816695 RepID=UPI0008F900EE|nr:hypothetical protein [Bacillus tuaregi]